MLRTLFLVTAVVAAACGGGQTYVRGQAAVYVDETTLTVPAGARMTVALDQFVSPMRNPVGDVVRARTIYPIHARSGEILVPAGARVYARVVDVYAAGPRSGIYLQPESIEMGGRVQRLRGEIIAAAVPQNTGYYSRGPILLSDRRLRGDLPPGTQLEIELSQPIHSLAAVRSRYY
jgi:hypothetical protein